jgi:DNA-binding beta-propeller fold protein YncE
MAVSSPAMAGGELEAKYAFFFPAPGVSKGLAVDEADGHVYVSLPRTGKPPCKFGCVEELAVSPGSPEGHASVVRTLEVPDPTSIAVDNAAASPSHDDVYVAGTTKAAAAEEEEAPSKFVYKFAPSGEAQIAKLSRFDIAEGKKTKKEKFEGIEGLAIDSTGKLLVYDEEAFFARFNNAVENESELGAEGPFSAPTPGLAVDSHDRVFAGHESESEIAEGTGGEPPVVGKCEFAVVEGEGECTPLIGELQREATRGVAVDSADEVFLVGNNSVTVNNETTHKPEDKKETSLTSFTDEGAQIQRAVVQAPNGAPEISEGDAIALNSSSASIYIADAASDTVDVLKLAPKPAGPPRVDGLSACITTQCSPEAAPAVRLTATVDPDGADTHAFFEYGTSSCAATCEHQSEPQDLGSGFGDVSLKPLELSLTAGVTYYFRVVASNGVGPAVKTETETIAIPATASLPDGRKWEMVSPADKHGYEVEPLLGVGGVIQASKDGSAITYIANGPIHCEGEPEGSRNPEPAQLLAVRGSSHWGCEDMATANSAAIGANVGQPQEYQAFTPNLSISLLEPFPGGETTEQWALPALSPPVSERERCRAGVGLCAPGHESEKGKPYQEKTIYERDDAPLQPEASSAEEQKNYAAAKRNGELMPNAGFLPLVDEADALGVLDKEKPPGCEEGLCFGGGKNADVEVLTATPDLSHVLIVSLKASRGLYEWSGEKLKLVSILPNGLPAPKSSDPLPGDHSTDVRNAISTDGNRVFWSEAEGEHHLYATDTQGETPTTIQLDEPEKGTKPEGSPEAIFQTASTDGSMVFFTDTQRLTADSRAHRGKAIKPDLYVYELESHTVRDLTAEGINQESFTLDGESGAVAGLAQPAPAGGVIGASEDGSYVYFVANGALAPGAKPGDCEVWKDEAAPQKVCNLYEMHRSERKEGNETLVEWKTTLVAVLSSSDAADWGVLGVPSGNLAWMTARVSPNGRFLAFMSSRSLTGYDNEDAKSKARDEEVFLFDAREKTLVCASCNPTGAAPEGVFDPPNKEGETGEGIGLVVDRQNIWGEKKVDHWLAGSVPGWTPVSLGRALYQSRYLSNEGRLFFNSPDHLVPAATGAKEKVYEYEPTGVGSCSLQGGCIGLLSSPNSEQEPKGEHESAFVDASESGNDVFFITTARLTTGDVDTSYDLYDARVCQQGSPCLGAPAEGSVPCETEVKCKGAAPELRSVVPPASMTASASGNVARVGTLPSKEAAKPKTAPKKLTKAQLLAKALKACRSKYKGHGKSKQRAKCEARARKQYGHASRHKKSHKASRSRGGGAR